MAKRLRYKPAIYARYGGIASPAPAASRPKQFRMHPPSRGAMRPSHARTVRPKKRAWGMPGARCTRSRAWCVESTRVSHHGRTGITRHSRTRVVLTVSFALSPVIGLFCHRRLRIWLVRARSGRHASANLTPASRRQDHTTSPSAASICRQRAIDHSQAKARPATTSRARRCRVHRIPFPTSVTIAIRPSFGTGWREF
jgi:hypothetical protein